MFFARSNLQPRYPELSVCYNYLVSPLIYDRHVNVVYKHRHFLPGRRAIGGSHSFVNITLYRSLKKRKKQSDYLKEIWSSHRCQILRLVNKTPPESLMPTGLEHLVGLRNAPFNAPELCIERRFV